MKRSIKYILIALVNLIILTYLLSVWSDRAERIFNELVRPIQFFILLCLTVAVLISIRIQVIYFRRRKITSIAKRMKYSILLMLILSSFFYAKYTKEIIENKIINKDIRVCLLTKIEPLFDLSDFSRHRALNLSIDEYNEIRTMNWFPEIPIEASNISYEYWYDGFLPDYNFELQYEVPKDIKVLDYDNSKDEYDQVQKSEIVKDKKIVYYREGQR